MVSNAASVRAFRGDKRASGGVRKTTVSRMPFWCPWDRGGRGDWRLLPVGPTHQQLVEGFDDLDNPLPPMGLYQYKGYVSIRDIPEDDPRRDLLPTNWRDMCRNHKVLAVYPERETSTSKSKDDEPAE